MKKSVLLMLAAGVVFLSSCTNQGSSTVATRDDDQDTTAVPAKNEKDHTEVKKEGTTKAYADSSATPATGSVDSTK